MDYGTAILRRLKRHWFRRNCALQAMRRRLEPRIKQRNVEKSLINTNSVAGGRTIRGGDKRISGSLFFFFVYGSGVEMTTALITDEFFFSIPPMPPCNKLERAMWRRITTLTNQDVGPTRYILIQESRCRQQITRS